MALRRLGWVVAPPEGVKVNDRIVRMAQETAGRTLRSAKWRADLTVGVLKTWPVDPARRTPHEWDAVREAVPGGRFLPSSVIKSRTRQVAAFVRKHRRLPADVFELEPSPRIARMLLLSACDGQQASIERPGEPRRALLRLQLPTRPDPASYKDWTWVASPITLAPTVPADAVLHLPTLRIHQGSVRADLAYTHAVPKTRQSGHTVALGVDWGLNTLLSAGAARLDDGGRITGLGSGAQFRAAGVVAKQHRLRRLSEYLHAKADRYRRLIAEDEQHPLIAKHRVLTDEIRHVGERRSNLNDALARAAARWAVDQAFAAGASVIYLEDLRSMEAKGMGRTMNTRLSQQVRGQIVDHMRHLAAEAGIAVVIVPAHNTSKHCPQCLTPLRHRKAPTGPPLPAGRGPSARTALVAGGRATATKGHGGELPHAASPTRPRLSRTVPAAPWSSAPWLKRRSRRQSSLRLRRPAETTGPRPAPPGTVPHAPRPGDAGHPPPAAPQDRRASVRRDTHQRAGTGYPAQPTGTRT